MAQTIPLLNGVPRQSLVVTLAGQESANCSSGGNPSDAAWYASLESPIGTPIAASRRLAKGSALIAGRQTSFVGDLYVVTSALNAEEPALDAWGQSHVLVFSE